MGPQLYRCGNLEVIGNFDNKRYKLQWGRNFIVAEILPQTRTMQ